jgi:hypothetical protein
MDSHILELERKFAASNSIEDGIKLGIARARITPPYPGTGTEAPALEAAFKKIVNRDIGKRFL